jgi:(p)ppGpp synthase/HD superfamily hydrolase
MSELVKRAEYVARAAHAGQVDKAGRDYFEAHVADVARRVRCYGPVVESIALLHDVVEDTDVSLEDLRKAGFPEPVVAGVDAMTKRAGESKDDYYERVKGNEVARTVKVEGDIPSNTDPARVAALEAQDPAKAARLAVKYEKALEALA